MNAIFGAEIIVVIFIFIIAALIVNAPQMFGG